MYKVYVIDFTFCVQIIYYISMSYADNQPQSNFHKHHIRYQSQSSFTRILIHSTREETLRIQQSVPPGKSK